MSAYIHLRKRHILLIFTYISEILFKSIPQIQILCNWQTSFGVWMWMNSSDFICHILSPSKLNYCFPVDLLTCSCFEGQHRVAITSLMVYPKCFLWVNLPFDIWPFDIWKLGCLFTTNSLFWEQNIAFNMEIHWSIL